MNFEMFLNFRCCKLCIDHLTLSPLVLILVHPLWAQNIPIPINISDPVGESVIDVVGGVAIHATKVEVPNEHLRNYFVEGTHSIQEEQVTWFFECVN